MNKIIEQFRLESLEWNEELQDWFPNTERFARLIVRECALTLYNSAFQDNQAGFVHEAKVMELAGDMIKQHFGIE